MDDLNLEANRGKLGEGSVRLMLLHVYRRMPADCDPNTKGLLNPSGSEKSECEQTLVLKVLFAVPGVALASFPLVGVTELCSDEHFSLSKTQRNHSTILIFLFICLHC